MRWDVFGDVSGKEFYVTGAPVVSLSSVRAGGHERGVLSVGDVSRCNLDELRELAAACVGVRGNEGADGLGGRAQVRGEQGRGAAAAGAAARGFRDERGGARGAHNLGGV